MYALLILLVFSCLSGYYVYMRPNFVLNSNPLHHHNFDQHQIDVTWPEYLKDCGGEKVIDNFVAAKMAFNEKYENNVVSWSGYFVEVKNRQQGISLFENEHFMSILIKMSPSESDNFPDLVLSISSSLYNNNKGLLKSLKKGDGLDFKGALVG
jgi:hypothetical protein